MRKLFTLTLALLAFFATSVWAEDFTISPINGSYLSPGNLVKLEISGDLKISSTQVQTSAKSKSGTITITTIAPGVYLKSASFTDANSGKLESFTCSSGGTMTNSSPYTFTAGENTTTATFALAANSSGAAKLGSISIVVTNGESNNIETLTGFTFSSGTFSFTEKCNGATVSPVTVSLTSQASSSWSASSSKISAPSSNDSKTITISSENDIKYIAFVDAECRLSLVEKSSTGGTCDGASWTAPALSSVRSVTFKNGISTGLTIPTVYVITEVPPTYSITYALNGGSGTLPTESDKEAGATFTLHDGVTGITAPAGKEFEKWKDQDDALFNGGATYTMPAKNVTLTAQWRDETVKYAVTYDLNGASGDAPTSPSKAKDDVITLAAAPSWTGYHFDGWKCNIDGVTYAAGAEYTMTAAATTFTAQWTQLFTVTYYDGAATLGSEQVANGESPANADSYKTRPKASFVGWYSDPDLADGHAIANVAALTITANTSIYGKWTKTYAESVDFEQWVIDNTKNTTSFNNLKTWLGNHGYDYSNLNSLDSLDKSKTANNYPYLGLKFKTNAGYIQWNVPANKLVIVKNGNIGTTTKVYANGVAKKTLSSAGGSTPNVSYFYETVECLYKLDSEGAGTNIIKAITITNPFEVTYNTNGGDAIDPVIFTGTELSLPTAVKGTDSFIGWYTAAEGGTKVGEAGDSFYPSSDTTIYAHFEAISTDARLSSITLSTDAGTWSPTFNQEVTIYSYTMPYGTASIPTITGATAVNAKAQEPEIVQQAANWGDTAIIRGVAESGDKKTYKIAMLRTPKDGACLIKANVGDNTLTIDAEASIYTGTATNVNVKSESSTYETYTGWKMNTKGCYLGLVLDDEYSFAEGDIVEAYITTVAGDGTNKKFYVFSAPTTSDLSSVLLASSTEDQKQGVNRATLPADPGKNIYLCRGDDKKDYVNQNPYVAYIAVYRSVPKPVLDSIKFNGYKATINQNEKTASVVLPKNTVVASVTVTPYIMRNAAHATTPEAVITNSGTWIEGTNTYRIMDKDGDYTDYVITIAATGTALDNTADEIKAVKFVENGQLFIKKNGKIYNAVGAVVK